LIELRQESSTVDHFFGLDLAGFGFAHRKQ